MKIKCILNSLPGLFCFLSVVYVTLSSFTVELIGSSLASKHNPRANVTNGTSYDYIVVGSGPGGGPLASRLAIAGFKVLLIDAGSDQGSTDQEKVPTLWPVSTQYAPMQWNYFINHYSNLTRQERDTKFTWQTPAGDYYIGADPPTGSQPLGILYPRAGTLGGCSAHNAMITIYSHDSDWDYIATLTGDKSWEPAKMRDYFEKLERNEYLPGHPAGHGEDGWLGTSTLDPSVVVADEKMACHAAAAHGVISNRPVGATPQTVSQLGRITLADPNAPGATEKEGLYQMVLATSNGTRNGPRDFILNTANAVNRDESRKYHLDILLNTFVTKITFDRSGKVPWATGVEYLTGSGLYGATPASEWGTSTGSGSFTATREVIISAGAYNTPQLLKISGIGPKAELEKFNISVIVDSPGVGSNLQDRYETGVVTKTSSTSEILTGCSLLTTDPDICLEEWENGTTPVEKGFYTSNAFPLALIKKSTVAASDPDIFVFGGPVVFTGYYPGWANVSSLLPSTAPGWWSWIVLKAHVRNNAGTVTLRSTNPLDTPLINYNSFDTGTTAGGADQLDLQAFYEGVEFVRQINKELNCEESFEEVFPGPGIASQAETKAFIMQEAFGHHASCTAAIGADGDPNAVLDSSFRVRGVEGLRVVDASVFPKTPGLFPALPLYMISEKAADVIIQDAGSNIPS